MNYKKFIKYIFYCCLTFFILSVSAVILYRFTPITYTPLMIYRSIDKKYPIKHQWVELENISHYMQKTVVRSEDAKFYDHYGFDFEAIKKAQLYNEHHKKKKGASTISQQTAKNVFLWPSRTYFRKAMEAYFTVLIEFFWPKKRIMEAYLNVIELGPGIYGVEAASKYFFKKPAKKLTLAESALLTAVLPNPIKFKVNHPSNYILSRQSKIIGHANSAIAPNDSTDIKFDDEPASSETADEANIDENDEEI